VGKHSKLLMILTLAWTLSGCGSSGDSDDPNAVPDWCLIQYSTETTQVYDSGLVLEPSIKMYVAPEEVEWLWQQAKNCMNMPDGTVAPTVAYESFSTNDSLITGAMGQYKIPGLVLINTDNPANRRNCRTDASNLSHEFVHHLLYVSTGDPFPDTGDLRSTPNHGSPLFGPPSQGGCVPSF